MSKQVQQPVTTRSSPDKFARAGQIARRLEQLDADEAKALAEAPADIRARYQLRRDTVLAGVPDEVKALVERMRGGE